MIMSCCNSKNSAKNNKNNNKPKPNKKTTTIKKAITEFSSEHPGVTHHPTGSDAWDQRWEKRLLCTNACAAAQPGGSLSGAAGSLRWPDGAAEKCFAPRQSAGSVLAIPLN